MNRLLKITYISSISAMLASTSTMAAENATGRIDATNTAAFTQTSNEQSIRNFVIGNDALKPFGENLFSGQFSADKHDGLNPNYTVIPGDNITVAIWGAMEFNQTMPVDAQGNIFIPNVGPVKVAGAHYAELTNVVKKQVSLIYKDGIDIYTNLQGTKPVSVYVTGGINKPGRFSGVASDTVLHYIDAAQGIDAQKGSYRNIVIKRSEKIVAKVDVYKFLLEGNIPVIQLKDGDVIFISEKVTGIGVDGEAKRKNVFEFTSKTVSGSELIKYAEPAAAVTNVSVTGTRNKEPFLKYYTLAEFTTAKLEDGDTASFVSGNQAAQVKFFIEGPHLGPNVIIAPKNTTLLEVLNQIQIDPKSSDYNSVYIERASIAVSQRLALEESLRRLQENVLLTPSVSGDDASVRSKDAEMVDRFIEKAKNVKPKGRVVVSTEKQVADVKLEDGDRIVIPETTNIISVNGEVTMPKAMVYNSRNNYKDYIKLAGGYTDRAATDKVYVIKASGETFPAGSTSIEEGDEIIVLPEVKFQDMQLTKDIADIIYKMVLAVAIPVKLFEND